MQNDLLKKCFVLSITALMIGLIAGSAVYAIGIENGTKFDNEGVINFSNDYTNITAGEAWNFLTNTGNGIQIPIDVRTNSEWNTEHIDTPIPENPRHYCLDLLQNETMLQKFMTLYDGMEIVLYCGSGGRSFIATNILIDNNFNGVIYNMIGGITAWKQAGHPTISGGFSYITVGDAWNFLTDTGNGIQIPIDVRTNSEWNTEHIDTPIPENPKHHPLSDLQDETKLEEFKSLYNGNEIILYCKSGTRSYSAAQILVANEFNGTIHNMIGGITSWKLAGYPTKSNQPPYTPSNPDPVDDEINVDINADLSWTGGDPDGDSVTYDIYFGTSSPPPLIAANQPSTSYDPGTMSYDTIYYWKIKAWDASGLSSTGPEWSFTTEEELNFPPNIPNIPSGPISMDEGQTGTYSTSGTDPDGDEVQYQFDWDADGIHDYSPWTTLGPSGHVDSLDHSWNNAGTYTVKAQSRDEHQVTSDWSNGLSVSILESTNNNPNTPNTPTGPSNLNTGQTGTYTTSATDPDGDQVQYKFDWGDGQISTWTNLVPSGTTASKDHQWTTPGTYNVKSQTQDEHLATSSWSDELIVTITAAVEQLDQQQTQQDNDYSTYANNWIAQSFKPTLGTLTKVELYIGKKGNPTTDLIISIRSSNTGPDLTTITKSASEIPSTLNWIEFDFNDISITPENTYYIVMKTSGGNNFNAYNWGFGYFDPYNRGAFWKSSTSGSTWSEYTYYDFCFKTYGEPAGPPEPILTYSPSSYDFGNMLEGMADSTTFKIWNSGTGTLTYTLTETCSWITSITPNTGTSTGEQDTININIDTTGLSTGLYSYDISINSNGGNNIFTVTINIVNAIEQLDQEQTKQDNKLAVHSNNWIAQSFKPTKNLLTKIELLVGKKGGPTTDLIISIRETLSGSDMAVLSKPSGEIQSTLNWIEFDFEDLSITPDNTYFIVMRTSGGNNFDAYEWGFGYYDPYNQGSFWRSLNFGSSWTEYTYYDFCFKTYGI